MRQTKINVPSAFDAIIHMLPKWIKYVMSEDEIISSFKENFFALRMTIPTSIDMIKKDAELKLSDFFSSEINKEKIDEYRFTRTRLC